MNDSRSTLRPRNNWPMLRTFLNIIFTTVCFGLGLMVSQGWLGGLFFAIPLWMSYLYLSIVRPTLLQYSVAVDVDPAPPIPYLKHKAYRLFRYLCYFSDLLGALTMVGITYAWLNETPQAMPWLRFAHLIVACAWGVTATLGTLSELRKLRREIYVLKHPPQEQPTPQAQHYGPQ